MKLTILTCFIALTYVAADDKPVTLCGRQLANARVVVCYGNEYINKRSQYADYFGDQINEVDWPWEGRRGSLTANWARYKRDGLVDECCLKPCTTDVLLNYC